MHKKFTLVVFFSLQFLILFGQESDTKRVKYFDQDNKEINKGRFERLLNTGNYISGITDLTNQRKLVARENKGLVNKPELLYILLESTTNQKLDRGKPLVVIYHPGRDDCNSSGTADRVWIANKYAELESKLEAVAQVKPVFIYKEKTGLDRYQGMLTWHQDPESIIETTFFKQHYPCSSFVVMAPGGQYISYFGEFPKEFVWKAAKVLSN